MSIVIWGTGREGRAAEAFIKSVLKRQDIVFVDEASDDAATIEVAIKQADMVVKSPGVSLYHPLLRGAPVTSLLNLWWAHKPSGKTICITGTKGKSTTSALLGHVLNAMGYKAAVLGNIGVPVTEAPQGMDFLVLELSSYQAADFEGACDVAAVTSLYPEHLNWHGDLATYYRDKLNILSHSNIKIAHSQVVAVCRDLSCFPVDPRLRGDDGTEIGDGGLIVSEDAAHVPNDYLNRAHNRANVGVVLAIIKALGLDADKALAAMHDFKGLPHRQQELGERGGILFVDDSIATTPQAAIAAMDVYKGRAITLIAGGYDRGIDYEPLVEYVRAQTVHAVIGLGPSGQRIAEGLSAHGYTAVLADDMAGAVKAALSVTPSGGVVLLSPAAPSFGLFRDYIERGEAFAKEAGF